MTDSPHGALDDQATPFPWLICGDGGRWPMAVRRFLPQLIPQDRSIEVVVCRSADVTGLLSAITKGIVLWEIVPEGLGLWCDLIAITSTTSPHVLQLAVTTELSPTEQSVISELGVAAMVRHPEQMPKLAKLIHIYLAAPD